ncbi:ankyrin, partial [Wilcoxina mikolae CBS 423.85]
AAEFGTEGVVKLLLEWDADINSRSKNGCTPLSWAIERKRQLIVKVLLDHGADIYSEDEDQKSPLHYAVD